MQYFPTVYATANLGFCVVYFNHKDHVLFPFFLESHTGLLPESYEKHDPRSTTDVRKILFGISEIKNKTVEITVSCFLPLFYLCYFQHYANARSLIHFLNGRNAFGIAEHPMRSHPCRAVLAKVNWLFFLRHLCHQNVLFFCFELGYLQIV